MYREFGYAKLTVMSMQTNLDADGALRVVDWQPAIASQEKHQAQQIAKRHW